MKYSKTVTLKDGRKCLLKNADKSGGEDILEIFILTHTETDYLLSYADEIGFTAEDEGDFLQKKADSENEIEIFAEVGGRIVATAGIDCVGAKFKTRHRAEFGISVIKEYWGLGIGRALTEACIECAKAAGYTQLELEAVAENGAALALYESVGFCEYGRNPRGFVSRISGGYQETVLMRLELDNNGKAE